MKSYSIRVSSTDREEEFKQLALETGGELEEGHTLIRFSNDMGRGKIRTWHLDAGLYMRVWDLYLLRPIDFTKEALPVHITNNGFSLLCIHTPESVELRSINQHQQFNKARDRRFVLVPDAVTAGFQLNPALPVQLVEFSISGYWIRQQPGYLRIAKYFNDGVLDDGSMSVLIEPIQSKTGQLAARLIDNVDDPKADATAVFAQGSGIIKDFLTILSREELGKTSNNIDLYYEKIKEAESILLEHLQKTPPRMGMIAKMVALSESTLKRYFKLIYGKSVYDYYLNKKMDLARTILSQKPYSVNEIAELMGYEKVSHFIEIFKKHQGCSPGSINKKKQLENA
jgi:AraC-like DNA-binding protein